MLRRAALLTALAVIGLVGAAGWLGFSDSGLQGLARLAGHLSGGQLQIEQASGRLAGPLAIGRLSWQDAKRQIEANQIRLDWSPAALLQGRLEIAELHADSLHITSQPSDSPTPVPTDLQLPVAVNAKNIQISEFSWAGSFVASELSARLHSDGRHHQLDAFSARTSGIAIAGRATLDGQAPLPLDASAEIAGQLEQRPLAMRLTASGPLEHLRLAAVATQGLAGHAEAVLTPFADAAFASARIQLENIDPATWQPGAPEARLSISADLAPQGEHIIGSFGLTNHQPGPVDKGRLPLATLAGTLDWQGDAANFTSLYARLPGEGQLEGKGVWREQLLTLDLNASRLDAAQIASVLRPTRLNGQLSTTLGAGRQHLQIDLKDSQFKLQAEASHAEQRVELAQLLLSAGDARLSASGRLELGAGREFAANGELQGFDPARFARLPAARINASFKAAGRLSPKAIVDASFALKDSRLAGQPLTGNGSLAIDWPHVPRLDIQLASGANHLTAQGAVGQAGDRLNIVIAAPQLAPYGLDGSLDGQFSLSGSLAQPKIVGQLNAPRIGLPGTLRLSGMTLSAELGGTPTSPLAFDLAIAKLETPDQPTLLRAFHLQATGSKQAHRLQASGELAGNNLLRLSADGGLADGPGWQGQLRECSLSSPDKARNIQLLDPVPLVLASTGWRLGPARLGGNPLDWQATLQASADSHALQASLKARGSRIGQIDGNFNASMQSAWSLNRQGRWQGRLDSDIADLGWLAELIGEGWKSEGRLNGELVLAGTPARPLTNGRWRGEKLALRLPEQGLNLAHGELDVELRDNLLRIKRLGFDSLLQPMPRPLRVEARDDLADLGKQPGRLDISGEMRVDRALGHDSATDSAFLDMRLDRLGVFQLPDQWVAISGDGRLTWLDGTLGVHGKLAVDAGYWQLAPGGTPRLSDDVIIKRPGNQKVSDSLHPKLDIDLTTDLGRNFLFNGAGLSSRLTGDIRIAARGRDLPRASGTIRTRGGRFDAYGQKLDIERGVLNFNGLLDNPGLDVRAVRKGLAVEPGVQISGTARKPVVKLISDPELPEAEKLAWLVLGHGPEQMGAGDATLLLSAAGGLLGNDSGGVVQQLKKTFGFDEFGLRQGNIGDTGGRQLSSRVAGSSSVDTTGSTGNQILSVGKRLSSNALLSYEQTLGRAEGIVKLTVSLTRQIALVGRAGSDNAFDIFYTLSFGRADEKPIRKQDGR